MILPTHLAEVLAGLTEDQEALLQEILESPYFQEDPGVGLPRFRRHLHYAMGPGLS